MKLKLTEEEEFFVKNSLSKTNLEWKIYLKCSSNRLMILKNIFKVKTMRAKISLEKRIAISERRKKWLKENPDKHPWRRSDKFKSIPCEKVKSFLTLLKIEFIPEYQPRIENRFFSIDIAMPDKKIAIEINGNQHYNKDGTLKPYYQERHDLLEQNGWKVYEVHYSSCFDMEKWSNFLEIITNSPIKEEFDYFNYIPKQKKIKIKKEKSKRKERSDKKLPKPKIKREKRISFCDCGTKKENKAIKCINCYRKNPFRQKTKIEWPTVEEMKGLVWEFPGPELCRKLGISLSVLRKFNRKNNISMPGKGYWQKLKSKKAHQEGLEPT